MFNAIIDNFKGLQFSRIKITFQKILYGFGDCTTHSNIGGLCNALCYKGKKDSDRIIQNTKYDNLVGSSIFFSCLEINRYPNLLIETKMSELDEQFAHLYEHKDLLYCKDNRT